MNSDPISDATVVRPVSISNLWGELFYNLLTEQALICVKLDMTDRKLVA